MVTAVTTLLDEFGDGLIQQFGLSQDFATLWATARLAAFLHDLGKANDHFQAVVHQLKQPRQQPQLMRHEVVSVLLAWELRPWLSRGAGDVLVAIAAAGGHHLQLGGQAGKPTEEVGEIRQSGVDRWTRGDRLLLYTQHRHFIGLLRYGQKACGLAPNLPEGLPTTWTIADLKQRRGALEISRAISLDPYWGDIAFGSKGGEKGKTLIHSTEVHCTAYQYTLALTPNSLKKPQRALLLLDAVGAIRHVGGNHARFLYDFRPESIVIRLTEDPSPWIMDVFKRIGETVGCPRLVWLLEVGDVKPEELLVGGEIADTPYDQQLRELGVNMFRGVKEAIATAKTLLAAEVAA